MKRKKQQPRKNNLDNPYGRKGFPNLGFMLGKHTRLNKKMENGQYWTNNISVRKNVITFYYFLTLLLTLVSFELP